MEKTSAWLVRPQRKLGTVGLFVLIMAAGFMTPLSLDMYTPAVPHMTEYFDTTESVVNLTLIGYYLFFAIGMLVFGPVSDKYGRKPVFFWGMAAYTAGSALCAMATSIWALIAFRVVQALGAGAVNSVSTAVVKDAFSDDRRELVLSILQVLLMVAPMLAPVIGAFIIQVASWRTTFWVLTAVGAACLVLAALFEETLPAEDRYEGSVAGSIANLKTAFANKGFIAYLLILSAFSLPYMAYVSIASYVYIDFYGLSELSYSMYFAVVAAVGAVGPFVWQFVKKFWSARQFTSILLAISLAAGVLMLAIGQAGASLFCFSFVVFAFTESSVRPYSTNILLSQDIDAGVASAMINCMQTLVGCVGMALVVLPWPNYVVGLAVMILVGMGIAAVGWVALLKSDIPLKGMKETGEETRVRSGGRAELQGSSARS